MCQDEEKTRDLMAELMDAAASQGVAAVRAVPDLRQRLLAADCSPEMRALTALATVGYLTAVLEVQAIDAEDAAKAAGGAA
jgi:hypothetical protein